jgi:hypothetical protein
MNTFMNTDFAWFHGVVEDRADPLYLNRVRVRCFGYHTSDKVLLPTNDLPWATVVLPTTESGTSGVGRSPHGLVEGSWVVGFFRDGTDAQDPIILGSIASLNSVEANTNQGFYDPAGNYPKKTDDITTNYLNESDVNKAARGLATQASIIQEQIRTNKVANSDAIPALGFVEAKSKAEMFKLSGDVPNIFYFDEPASPAKPQYPFNKVLESESGHVFEVDDTQDFQRIKEAHRTGTFYEIHPDGSRVFKVIKDNYEVTLGDEYVNIKGTSRVTVEGDCNLFVVGNCNTEIQGNKKEHVYGNVTQIIEGSEFKTIKGNAIHQVTGYMTQDIGSYMTQTIGDYLNLEVGSNYTETISGTQSTTAANTTINNNVNIAGNLIIQGTTHSVGDVSTSAGLAPTLATHKHIPNSSSPPQ